MSGGGRLFRLGAAVYPIVDAGATARRSPLELAQALFAAGVPLLQLRAKQLPTRQLCELARAMQTAAAHRGARLIVDDRADVAHLVGAAGVHLGQSDLHPDDARRILGAEAIIGYSTHDPAQVGEAGRLMSIDYIGFGPIFPTRSKADPDPCQGIDGLRRVRTLIDLPIVAIGGITPATAAAVLAAGADAVAMIGALANHDDPVALVRALL